MTNKPNAVKYSLLLRATDSVCTSWASELSNGGPFFRRTKADIEELLIEFTDNRELSFERLATDFFDMADGDFDIDDVTDWQIYLLTDKAELLPLKFTWETKPAQVEVLKLL